MFATTYYYIKVEALKIDSSYIPFSKNAGIFGGHLAH